jgi:heme exporter protein CcmD
MFGDHAAFIIPAYAASIFVILLLIIWLRVQYSNCQKELSTLEQSGIKRRAAKTPDENSGK